MANLKDLIKDLKWTPVINEISLIAYGSKQQDIHIDYGYEYDVAQILQKVGPTYEEFKQQFFYGTLMYNFFMNEETNETLINTHSGGSNDKMVLHLEYDDKHIQKLRENEQIPKLTNKAYIQPGQCCFFAGHVKHAGGEYSRPFVRLHVHLDPPPNHEGQDSDTPKVPLRDDGAFVTSTAFADLPSATLRQRKFRSKQQHKV